MSVLRENRYTYWKKNQRTQGQRKKKEQDQRMTMMYMDT